MRQSSLWKALGLLWTIGWVIGCSVGGPEGVNTLAATSMVATTTATTATGATAVAVLTENAPLAAPATMLPLPPTAVPDVSTESNGGANDLLTPSATAQPSLTPTPSPTASPTVMPTSVSTAAPSPVPVNRRCPNPAPARPEYNHFWLSNQPWPTPAPAPESHFWLSKPVPGGGRLITSQILPYGFDGLGRYLLHNGVDMAEAMGTPVLAVADGTVIVAQSDEQELYGWRCNWYGRLVVIQLDETWQGERLFALYGHVLNIVVTPGERVWRGQQVAEVGIGGAAIAPHLHFELRVGENSFASTRNPLLWLSPGETRGVMAGRLIDPEGRPWQGHPVQVRRTDEVTGTVTAWTYVGDPQRLIHPDEGFAENFVLTDLRPGVYEVLSTVQGETYRVEVTVFAGSVSAVELVTAPYKTPTPDATSGGDTDSP